jgi:cytochrome P450
MPYLNSAFNETLRIYVDVLLTRTLDEDLTLNEYHMAKGGIVIAPTFLGHRHPSAWSNDSQPPENIWYGERFIKVDDKTGEPNFSTAGTNGRFFPFGGGVHVCPGRVFAKQEVFGAIAAFLLEFEVRFVEYLRFDKMGHPIPRGPSEDEFPVVKKQFCGSGVVISEGDMLVKLKRRNERH